MLRQSRTTTRHTAIRLTFKIEAAGGWWAAGDHGFVCFLLWVVFLVWEWRLVLRVCHWCQRKKKYIGFGMKNIGPSVFKCRFQYASSMP